MTFPLIALGLTTALTATIIWLLHHWNTKEKP